MSEAEIGRIRGDLETIRQAAGLGLPFGWEDVWLSLAGVPCGLILSVAGAFIHPLSYVWLAALPVLGVVVFAASLRYRFRRSTGRSTARRLEYDLGLGAAMICSLLASVFLLWARRTGAPILMIGGAAVSMIGGLCAVLALTSPGRRYWLASAIVLIAFGLVLPFCSPRQVAVVAGASLAICGLATAAIQAGQLRRIERDHEPATH